MTELREKIARLTDDYFAASDRAHHYDYELADHILALPEIAEALTARNILLAAQMDALPPETVGKIMRKLGDESTPAS